ncbi:MAG: hypothetical protein HOW73_14405 [Polyangiaceae bacterium]|nr:hypothetical protein [Polyangiaceae bacterium]
MGSKVPAKESSVSDPDARAAQSGSEKAASNDASFGELVSTERSDKEGDARVRAKSDGSPLVSRAFPVARKAALTGLVLGTLVLIPYAHPSLLRFRVLSEGISFIPERGADEAVPGMAPPKDYVGEETLEGTTEDSQDRGAELDRPLTTPKGPIAQQQAPVPAAVLEDKPPISIDLPDGGLDKFFDKLIAVENKTPGAVARIVYYGDSIVASDFITGKLRRMLQDRFGDAGHGYAIAANAFKGWFHIDVSRKSSPQWKTSTCIGPYAEDSLYGLGCVSFTARTTGEWFMMGTSTADKWGKDVSRFEIEYLEQPDGGDLAIFVDGEQKGTLSTAGPAKKVKYHLVEVSDGPHKLEVKTTSDTPTRVFGARMERDVPGVTLSALGITGARARFLDKQDDAHWAEVLKAAKPDLVVLAFGTNEVGDGRMAFDEQGQLSKDPMGDYERNLKAVMKQIATALPDASFMLVGPPDMASKGDSGEGHSKPMVPVIIQHQKTCATELGWPYWNQYKAMGGSGSMYSWVQSGLGNPDMIHPTGQGGNVLGKWLYRALMEKYEAYKEKKR